MRRRRWLAIALAAGVVAVVGAVAWGGWPRQAAAPGPTSPVASPAAALPPAEAAAYRALAPRLREAADQTRTLVAMGEERERNLLAIRREQGETEERLAAVDALAGAAPARFVPVAERYAEGARAVRRAMAEAQAGFVRLDWDRVARATELMDRGAGEIERAAALLDAAAGVHATPAGEASTGAGADPQRPPVLSSLRWQGRGGEASDVL